MGKTAGRWTKEEHKKFVQGNQDSISNLYRFFPFHHANFIYCILALKHFGKDWKRVEEFVQTRSGA